MNKAYSSLAKYYNRLAERDYDAYYNYVKNKIIGSVVELGAGAGRFTEKYIAGVKKAVLVDASPEMLNELSRSLKKYRLKSQIVLSDAECFEPINKADTVLAVCDVFNYIKNFAPLINKIGGYLNKGGYLIFDISTDFKLSEIIGDNVFYEDYDDVTFLWTNKFDGESVKMDITLFERDGEVYRRSDETGVQYAHKRAEIENALLSSGFTFTAVDADDFRAVRSDSLHILFVAQKF